MAFTFKIANRDIVFQTHSRERLEVLARAVPDFAVALCQDFAAHRGSWQEYSGALGVMGRFLPSLIGMISVDINVDLSWALNIPARDALRLVGAWYVENGAAFCRTILEINGLLKSDGIAQPAPRTTINLPASRLLH